MNDEFFYRTESISNDKLLNFFVEGKIETDIIESFFNKSHIILEGSRGSGKSFLMRVAHKSLDDRFKEERNLPVYITFMQSSLLHSKYENQFYYWMIARILRETMKSLQKKGLHIDTYASSLINNSSDVGLRDLIQKFENTYRDRDLTIDHIDELPELVDILDAIESICINNNIQRVTYFFDEAAHVFRPEQQRQFFSLFRDFKSPYVCCKASVYPGVTHYGNSFELTHDAFFKRLDRDILSENYLQDMKTLVSKQHTKWGGYIDKNGDLFNTLAFASGGNPRILLKTLDQCKKLTTSSVNDTIKKFYRNEIWLEHTQLGEKYSGHKPIVDWGRRFIEASVIPATQKKIEDRVQKGVKESTLYFWISKEAPQQIKEALRLLSYTGIIRKHDSGVKGTKSRIGDRYEIKYGCLLAQYSTPSSISKTIIPHVQLEMFTEYGENNTFFSSLSIENTVLSEESEFFDSIQKQLQKSVNTLDLSPWLLSKVSELNILTIGELLDVSETDLMKLKHIKTVRARHIKNAAIAEILETISG